MMTLPALAAAGTVSVTYPPPGAVSGRFMVVAQAQGRVTGVQLLLDGAALGPEDTTPPYAAFWNTGTATNGGHTVRARLREDDGSETLSAPVSVTVTNILRPPGFRPTDLDNLRFFVESIHGVSIATCATAECRAAPDWSSLELMYCDTGRFPAGCVRRWEDQSGYVYPGGFRPPEWTAGRDFGQDDIEKPGYIPDCINGAPCVRGGPDLAQHISLEIEFDQGVAGLSGPFSVIHVVRPVPQASDYQYFGNSNNGLRHNVGDNSLSFRIAGGYPPDVVTGPDAIANGTWHLIEVYRDGRNDLQVIVNGVDATSGQPNEAGEFAYGYLLSMYKGQDAMYGDVAAAIVYADLLTAVERQQVRDYLDAIYGILSSPDGSARPNPPTLLEVVPVPP
jgi:hypothetical protein